MKRLIIISSLSLCSVLAFALANADDMNTSASKSDVSQSSGQSAGIKADSHSSDSSSNVGDKEMKTSKTTTVRESNTCTDENGVTYKKSESGYKSCVKAMDKKRSDQMSGEAGTMSDSNMPNPSSTSNVMSEHEKTTSSESKSGS